MTRNLRISCLPLLLLLVQHWSTNLALGAACQLTLTNHSCTLTLSRNSFVYPPTIQMYPGQVVTVQITDGKSFESYTLDPAPGQANVLPDVTSSVLGNLNSILAAASSLGPASTSPVPLSPHAESLLQPKTQAADPCVNDPAGADCKLEKLKQELAVCSFEQVSQFSRPDCMMGLLQQASEAIVRATLPAKKVYLALQPYITPDAQPLPLPTLTLSDLLAELCGTTTSPSLDRPCALDSDDGLIRQQAIASANAAAVLSRITKPPSQEIIPPTMIYDPLSPGVLKAMQLVSEEQAALDAVRKDLEGYASRIQDLILDPPRPQGPIVGSINDSGLSRHLSRTVNYSLNRLNLVSNSQEAANDGSKKALIVTISVVYGEARWEGSSGVAVAFRPIRTFTVAPIITASTGQQTNSYISESKGGPELVPFASVDLRVGADFKLFGWRGALYATGGIGYNISQQSADFLVGPSVSWRGVLLSTLCDFGNGTRLGQGLTVGESLTGTAATSTTPFVPTTISTLPTTNYLVPAFTVGVSVRIPGISGR